MKRGTSLVLCSVFVALLIVAVPLIRLEALPASHPQQQEVATSPVPAPDRQFKNVQVLKETPGPQLVLSMHVLEGALGVDCEFCHLEKDRASDDKETKRTARKMMAMVIDINKNSFAGRQIVTCYTCHHGSSQPVNTAILPDTTAYVAPYGMVAQPPPALPTPEHIISTYIQALGGEQALRKITSRKITATRDIPTGPGGSVPMPAQTEIYQKAPDLMLAVNHAPGYTVSEGFDGITSWSQNMAGSVSDAVDPDQKRAKRSAIFYEPLELKHEYARLEVRGIQKVNGRDAYMVLGFPQGDEAERLYFDTQTGLLLRKITATPTPLGNFDFEVDYDDYRDTGSGVKIPFVTRMVPAFARGVFLSRSTVRVQKVEDNVPVDLSLFKKPVSKVVTAR